MVAVAAIKAGETLFEVPRHVLLQPGSDKSKVSASLARFAFPRPVKSDDAADAGAEESDSGDDASDDDASDDEDDMTDADAEAEALGTGWTPLLLTLMHEFAQPKSFWRPYLGGTLDPVCVVCRLISL